MDRLGDLNLINASPVCSQGHVPFCQDIRLRVYLVSAILPSRPYRAKREEKSQRTRDIRSRVHGFVNGKGDREAKWRLQTTIDI